MQAIFNPIFQNGIPRRRPVGLRPQVLYVIGPTQLPRNQVINLAVPAGFVWDARRIIVARQAVILENLLFHRSRNMARISAPFGIANDVQ
jgi:hypothetical protein